MIHNGIRKRFYRVACLLSCLLFIPVNASATSAVTDNSGELTESVFEYTGNSYFEYYKAYADKNRCSSPILLSAKKAADYTVNCREVDSRTGVLVSPNNSQAEWSFSIDEDGLYCVCMSYYAVAGKNNEITFSLTLDGNNPYTEAKSFTATRIWKDDISQDGFDEDTLGNDRLPVQVEVSRWQEQWISDVQGMYCEPYFIYLTSGVHTIGISSADDEFIIENIKLGTPDDLISYDEYREKYANAENSATNEKIMLEAALTTEKSSSDLYPLSDRTSPATKPNEAGKTKLNSIGGSNWGYSGQSISWEINVPKNGWYTISMRERQNTNQGLNSYRAILIDGEIPFAEAENICFTYSMKWHVTSIGGDSPYEFYLTEGKHTFTLQCVAGPMCEALRELNQAIIDLNSVYRKIITVTGTSPDSYRDYNLDTAIDGLISGLEDLSVRLTEIADKIEKITGTRQSQVSVLDEMSKMLTEMAGTPYTIPTRLTNYKTNVESIGSLLLSLTKQPLTIDYIEFVPKQAQPNSGKVSLWESLVFHLVALLSSYSDDYNSFDTVNDGENAVDVWVSSGRDQVKIINQIINDIFVPQNNIPINLSIVDTSTTLIEATLAGKGPDVALSVPQDTPVNLASRNALVDLNQFQLGELADEIDEQSFVPFEYNGGLYALPETQVFHMLFYRTDVFEQLGLSVPETWEEFYEVMNILRFNNLEVGIAEVNKLNRGVSLSINLFETLLYQNGASLFNENLNATALDTDIAYTMFERVVKLYTDYGLDQEYDFFNRFRTGEMAMAIENYSAYNQLKGAAPELNQLWSFAPIPGTVTEDGSLNRSAVGSVTGCIMLKSAEEKGIEDEAWKFISWWVSADTQAYYANMLESTMGILGRYTPANYKAFEQMRWSSSESDLLLEQWESVVCIPEIPGGYYVNRSLTSALRTAISENSSARRELALYNVDINSEITRKRKEFGLSVEGE